MTDDLKQKITNAIATMHGWCSPEKALLMADLILRTKPDKVVEIGVFGGRSLLPQAMALRENGRGMVYGIDPWKKEWALEGDVGKDNADWWNKLDLHDIHRSCMEEVWKHGLDKWCLILRCPSPNSATLFADEQIDILHVDGCHSEAASCRDVSLYLPKVKSGGWIFFDDVDWQTTQKALRMMDAACKRVDQVGTCVLFQKP